MATLASRILGMVREIVYARFMGDGLVASAFVLAFQIPNLFRRLLGEGALSAAFIPIFKQKEREEGPETTWRAANAVVCGLILAAGVIVVLMMIGVTIALAFWALTFKERLMLELLRMMFPYMLLACITAVFMGMLNARGHFFIPAIGPINLNIIMIGSVFLLAPRFGTGVEEQIFGLAVGVLIAGVVQAAFQMPQLHREGYRFEWVNPFEDPTVRKVVQRMLPGMVGVAAFQLNVVLTSIFAFGADENVVASFNYAVRVMELPQGVFGISMATYLLTTLSGLAAEENYTEFKAHLKDGTYHVVFLNLLATILLVVCAEPIIRLLFERNAFTPESTERASRALMAMAPGLISFSLVNIFARAFFALGDTTTPMRISVAALMLNLIFVYFLVMPFKGVGLGIANTLSSLFNLYLLFYALRRKFPKLRFDELPGLLWRLTACAGTAGLIAWGLVHWWTVKLGHANLLFKLGEVFVPLTVATVAYLGLALALKVPAAKEILKLVRPGKKVAEAVA